MIRNCNHLCSWNVYGCLHNLITEENFTACLSLAMYNFYGCLNNLNAKIKVTVVAPIELIFCIREHGYWLALSEQIRKHYFLLMLWFMVMVLWIVKGWSELAIPCRHWKRIQPTSDEGEGRTEWPVGVVWKTTTWFQIEAFVFSLAQALLPWVYSRLTYQHLDSMCASTAWLLPHATWRFKFQTQLVTAE